MKRMISSKPKPKRSKVAHQWETVAIYPSREKILEAMREGLPEKPTYGEVIKCLLPLDTENKIYCARCGTVSKDNEWCQVE